MRTDYCRTTMCRPHRILNEVLGIGVFLTLFLEPPLYYSLVIHLFLLTESVGKKNNNTKLITRDIHNQSS